MLASRIDLSERLFFTVDDVLTKDECDELIVRIDDLGPTVALVSRSSGAVLDLGTRNNTRVIFDDAALADTLFQRVRKDLPEKLMGMSLVSANERLRCYRYAPGERFAPHYDGSFVRNEKERSLLTFMVYLNEGFEGGATELLDLERTVVPKTGRALLFQHAILHEGSRVTSGVKYVVRSDILYRK